MARPWQWGGWLSLSPTGLALSLSCSLHQVQQQETLRLLQTIPSSRLTSTNTRRAGWGEGEDWGGWGCPTPLELPSTPSAFHLLSK